MRKRLHWNRAQTNVARIGFPLPLKLLGYSSRRTGEPRSLWTRRTGEFLSGRPRQKSERLPRGRLGVAPLTARRTEA